MVLIDFRFLVVAIVTIGLALCVFVQESTDLQWPMKEHFECVRFMVTSAYHRPLCEDVNWELEQRSCRVRKGKEFHCSGAYCKGLTWGCYVPCFRVSDIAVCWPETTEAWRCACGKGDVPSKPFTDRPIKIIAYDVSTWGNYQDITKQEILVDGVICATELLASPQSYVLESGRISYWRFTPEFCPRAAWVNKYDVWYSVENGIRLHCNDTASIPPRGGGEWTNLQHCPIDSWIVGFKLELYDSKVNDIRVRCRASNGSHVDLPANDDPETWKWGEWALCPSGSAVCGIATSRRNYYLSDVTMYCCDLYTDEENAPLV